MPVETEPLKILVCAGFVGIEFEKLGDIHCFGTGGIELRELRLRGQKPLLGDGGTSQVMYRGPFAAVVGECGTTFHRGEPTSVATASVAAYTGAFTALERGSS